MNFKTVKNQIILALAILLIGLGFGFFLGSSLNRTPANVTSTNTNQPLPTPTTTPSTFDSRYINSTFNFSFEYPDDLKPETNFSQSYLLSDSWNLLAVSTSTGEKIVNLKVPNSDDVTSGELRIGASRNPEAIQDCLNPPDYLTAEQKNISINNNTFTEIHFSEGAMNHYSDVYAYRLIKNSTCYAVDVFVVGTNPEVYDPPRTAPFTKEYAFDRLRQILNTLKIY